MDMYVLQLGLYCTCTAETDKEGAALATTEANVLYKVYTEPKDSFVCSRTRFAAIHFAHVSATKAVDSQARQD